MHGAIALAAEKPIERARVALFGIAGFGAAAILAMRVWLGWELPMWLDETWTAVISNQPSWTSFWREAWLDCNAPLYYAFMALWTDVAGNSNWALRGPSLIFVALAGFVPILWRAPGLSREASVTWGALLFFWWPGIAISIDARVYALLLLISVVQSIAFVRLLHEPTVRKAWLWTCLASLSFFAHYYSAYVIAAQMAVYLWFHWRTFWRVLPTASAFVPSLAWAIYHLPRLADYADPGVAWYEPIGTWGALVFMRFVIGPSTWVFPLLIVLGAFMLWRWKGARDESRADDIALKAAVVSGLIALALALAIGMVRPSLTDRYLTPIVPLALLGLVMVARRMDRAHTAYALLCGSFLAGSLTPMPLSQLLGDRSVYGYERGSNYLMKVRPTQVIFFWDHPAAGVLDRNSLRQIGGFFFDRAGMNVQTVPIILDDVTDANPVLVAAATGERPVILWLYNIARRSAAGKYEPRLHLDPRWQCTHYRRKSDIGIMACAPRHLMR